MFQLIAAAQLAQVNLPVAGLIRLMIVPMLLKIDSGGLHRVREHWHGIGVTLFVNWAVKPFSMALLGLAAISVPWRTRLLSVGLYIVIPLLIAQTLRRQLHGGGGEPALRRLLARLQPLTLAALLATLVVLFAFQGRQTVSWYERRGTLECAARDGDRPPERAATAHRLCTARRDAVRPRGSRISARP